MTTDHPPYLLIADDDEAFRTGLITWLTRQGCICHGVSNGPAALDALRTQEFHVLISDIFMPGNVGLELIEQVPQVAAGLPVILLTGNASVATAVHSVRLAVAAYLVKPPNLPELLELVHRVAADYRRLRAIADSRAQLQRWDGELQQLSALLRQRTPGGSAPATHDYLRVTLRHVLLQLTELDQCLAATATRTTSDAPHGPLDLISALRHTIAVLEQTKQNFKSKPLADLRRQLEDLLTPPTAPPAQ